MVSGTLDTAYSPKEILSKIHKLVEELNKEVADHQSSNVFVQVNEAGEILHIIDKLKLMFSKFEMSFIKLLMSNAKNLADTEQINPEYHTYVDNGLDKIEELLKQMRKSEINEIRKSRYMGRTSHHLMKRVEGMQREVDDIHKRNLRIFKSASRKSKNKNR